MKLKKTFSSFINETAVLQQYPKPKNKRGLKQWNSWKDMLEKIEYICEQIRTLDDQIKEEYNYGLHEREYRAEAYEFNVKMYDVPGLGDTDALADKYFDGSDTEMDQAFVEFVGQSVGHFIEDLYQKYKIDWIKDYYQVGRSGGWLVLELEPGTWSINEVAYNADMYEEDFNYESEELVEYDDETETFTADIKEMKKVFKTFEKNALSYLKDLEKHESELDTIKKLIPKYQAQMGKDFVAMLKANY